MSQLNLVIPNGVKLDPVFVSVLRPLFFPFFFKFCVSLNSYYFFKQKLGKVASQHSLILETHLEISRKLVRKLSCNY